MKRVSRIFLQGLLALLPIALTLYIVYWLGSSAEALLGRGIRLIVPDQWYWPGMGLIAGFAAVFAVGILTQAWIVRRLIQWGEALLNRIPLVKSLYSSVSDLMSFFSGSDKQGLSQVVLVTFEALNARVLGFVTRETFADLHASLEGNDLVAVYLPMSYQVGGYTVIVPRRQIEPVNLSIEEAMRFAVTAGMTTKKPARDLPAVKA